MSTTTVKLLQTAAEIVGGTDQLAEHLGLRPGNLALYLADARPMPDPLLLKAVDIILEDRRSRFPLPGQKPAAQADDR